MRDLVVAGGGPVGLAAALFGAQAGIEVTVLEPRRGPIDKACGEGLMPGALAALNKLGIDPPGHDLRGIRYTDGSRHAEARFKYGTGRGVRRTALHDALRQAALRAGVHFEERAVGHLTQERDRVIVDGEPARYLIAADGLHSPIRRGLGLDAGHTRAQRRFGLRVHASVAPWTSFVEVHWAAAGEAYVTPVGPQEVGVAILTNSPRPFDQLIGEFGALSHRLAGVATSKAKGAGPLRQRATRRVAGRVLLVGDAGGYVDALTGEGMALGFAQAQAAVQALATDRPRDFERRAHQLSRRHELLTQALVTATRATPVRSHLVGTAARFPAVFSLAVNQLARPA